jgi:hypothetical protein
MVTDPQPRTRDNCHTTERQRLLQGDAGHPVIKVLIEKRIIGKGG